MEIGLDLGYDSTKAKTRLIRAMFLSVVGTPDRAQFSLTGNGSLMLLQPNAALVGQSAVIQSRFVERREDRAWVTSDEWLTLAYAALTECSKELETRCGIVTGLPVAFYDDKATVIQRLMGEHIIQREGRNPQHFVIEHVRVIPQPFGSFLSLVLNERGIIVDEALARGNSGIIDIGGKTTNILSTLGLAAISHETMSVNRGGWELVRAVRVWLAKHYPGLDELRDHRLAEAIRRRSIKYRGAEVEGFAHVVNDHAAHLVDEILATAGQLWNGGATLDNVFVTGGGALLLGSHIRQRWPYVQVIEDAQFGNVYGYWKFAMRLWG